MQHLLSRLPKVDHLLDHERLQGLMSSIPRRLVLNAVRTTLDRLRQSILNHPEDVDPTSLDISLLVERIAAEAERLARPKFRRVINATGVIIHTNLGRSLMAEEAMAAIVAAGQRYSNLEFDLDIGRRGSRYSHVEELLCELTGAEAALVVNNNAGAVLIALATVAAGREVIVSRGQLVEIGGSFRIPDVMAASGARLVEIGTTNKTHLFDYENAVTEETALILKVHQSNFRIMGFTQDVGLKDLVALGARFGLPVMEDLGSGSLVDFSVYGLEHEPTVQEAVQGGLDVVTFSGDKLLGGPQAGLLLGKKAIIDRIKKHPLNRALRIDKFTLAGLEATLRLYLEPDKAVQHVPTLRMISESYDRLCVKAERLRKALLPFAGPVEVGEADGFSQIGGGALPEQNLKTRMVTLKPGEGSASRLESHFRAQSIPVIGRIENELFLLDVRTMFEDDFDLVARGLAGFQDTVS